MIQDTFGILRSRVVSAKLVNIYVIYNPSEFKMYVLCPHGIQYRECLYHARYNSYIIKDYNVEPFEFLRHIKEGTI